MHSGKVRHICKKDSVVVCADFVYRKPLPRSGRDLELGSDRILPHNNMRSAAVCWQSWVVTAIGHSHPRVA